MLLAVAVLATGCRQSSLTISATEDPAAPGMSAPGPVVTDPDDVVALALDDLRSFWQAEMPELYDRPFTPLRGGYVAYGPRNPLPACGEEPITYQDIAENALYCPSEDLIAWDRVGLMPQLLRDHGALTAGIVMAHEFAHAIQARADVSGATVTLELQADCFAGAWVADVDDRLATFATAGDALDQALAGLLDLRDQIGVAASDPQAHGSGFDRINAFQQGFEQTTSACVGYEETPPTVVATTFGTYKDLNNGGNLPLDELVPPLLHDLESFYDELFSTMGRTWDPVDHFDPFRPAEGAIDCGGDTVSGAELDLASFYCASDDTIYIDATGLVPALDGIGDFAFGGEVAHLYAVAAQSQLGITDRDVDGRHADCLTGVYSAAEFEQRIADQKLQLSPGDLDEIIIAFLTFGDDTGVSAFERTDAFRTGFSQGEGACDEFLR